MSKINNEDKYLLVVSKTSPLTKEHILTLDIEDLNISFLKSLIMDLDSTDTVEV